VTVIDSARAPADEAMSSNAAGVARNILHENVIGFPPAPGQSWFDRRMW
jgi:hypothetical protein